VPQNILEHFQLRMILDGFNMTSYRYTGSLTTPPCTTGVNWLVLRQTLKLTRAHMQNFAAMFPTGNNRDVQPLGPRVVQTDSPL
jgi:carbonic anhydrase